MKTSVKSWLFIALVAAGVAACTGRGTSPIPPLQPVAGAPGASDDGTVPDVADQAIKRCATPKTQRAWIFLGQCRFRVVRAPGGALLLPPYRGYSVRLNVPKNRALKGARIGFVDATGVDDAKQKAGKPFPLNGKAFLYLQTINAAKPVVFFNKQARMKLTVRSTQTFVASQCGVSMLAGGTWRKLAGTNVAPAGGTLVFSIPTVGRIAKGSVYYSISCTATAPTPPPYCGSYTVPASATVPLDITDDSGLGEVLLVYITNGTSFMDNSGNFDSSTANPYPAACFSTTSGSAGSVALKLPAGISSGRIYFAYATPVPGQPSVVPNPMTGVSVAGPGFGYGLSPYPYDKIEYGLTPGAVIDTTQVDALGLPLELSVTAALPSQADIRERAAPSGRGARGMPAPCATSAPGIVGVTSCNFANIFTQMETLTPYNQLVLAQPFGNSTIDMQIVSPQNASGLGFQLNLFALQAYAPSATVCNGVTETYGYLSCVMSSYQTTPRLYSSSAVEGVTGTSGDNYCASSDNSSNFIFTDIGAGTSCAGSPTPKPTTTPFDMPVQEFTYGTPPGSSGCTQNLLFGLPWGNAQVGAGQIFGTPDAFAMWKAVGVDLNRGVALSSSIHPVGGATPVMSDFFQDPLQNQYAYLIHYYFNQNLAYALAFDDSGNFESGVDWETGDPINIRINAVPTASAVLPASPPSGLPVPNPCTALPTNV